MKNKTFFTAIAFLICLNTYCQVFDNELINNVSNRGEEPRRPDLTSLSTKEVDVSLNQVISDDLETDAIRRKGSSIEEISKLANAPSKSPTFDSPMGVVSKQELIDNQKTIKQDENNSLFLYGFLFIIFIIAIIFIFKYFSTNENVEASIENSPIPINNRKNKEKDIAKILSELKKLQSLKKTGAITEEEFKHLKKDVLN